MPTVTALRAPRVMGGAPHEAQGHIGAELRDPGGVDSTLEQDGVERAGEETGSVGRGAHHVENVHWLAPPREPRKDLYAEQFGHQERLGLRVKVVLQRAEAKDYRDVAAVIRAAVSLPHRIASACALFGPGFQPAESLKEMVYFAKSGCSAFSPPCRMRDQRDPPPRAHRTRNSGILRSNNSRRSG